MVACGAISTRIYLSYEIMPELWILALGSDLDSIMKKDLPAGGIVLQNKPCPNNSGPFPPNPQIVGNMFDQGILQFTPYYSFNFDKTGILPAAAGPCSRILLELQLHSCQYQLIKPRQSNGKRNSEPRDQPTCSE